MTSSLTAFITGASRGIGAAIAYKLASNGLAVAVCYRDRADAADEVVAKILANGGRALAIPINTAERSSIRDAIRKAEKLGPIGILVNNAAIAQEKPFLSISDKDWDLMLATNLRGPFACAQELLPSMLERGYGRIVNIVSIGGQWGGINQIHYASAKAGLIGLTRSIAKTFSRQGITCNAVSPGLVATEMVAAELKSLSGQEKINQIPVGRLGLAEEIAGCVSYLVGPDGAYVTGQTINVNGGMYFG